MMASARSTQPIDRDVGQRLRQFRLQAGFTQKQLAQAVGVSFQQLQKYESGINRISASRVAAIARCLNLPVEAFFGARHDAPPVLPPFQDGGEDQAADLLLAFSAIPDAAQRRAILYLVRSLMSHPERSA